MKQLRFILLVLIFGISCQKDEPVATNGNISGRVVEIFKNEPISGASVTIKGNQITTGSDGTFSVEDIYADSYEVSVSKAGYESDSKTVTVTPEKTVRADFSLKKLLPIITPNSLIFDKDNLQKTITLENRQTDNLSFTIQTSQSWISVSPQSATIEPGNSIIITVNINPETIEYGTYNESLVVNVATFSTSVPINFVYESEPFITITNPILDGVYKMGEIMPISWTSNLNGKAKIELFRSESSMLVISSEIENNDGGNYSWEIPALSPDAYFIKITSIEYPDIFGQSDPFILEIGPTKPIVTTGGSTEIQVNSIKIKGEIISLGIQANEVSQYGHVYSSENPLPDISNDRINLGSTSNVGEFESHIVDLVPGDSYYIRAYAINEKGASYGEAKLISTLIGAPALTTGQASDITQTSAKVNATLDSNGGGSISERGILWSNQTSVNINSNKIIEGNTTQGEYSVNLNGLTTGTTYYYKAYAINPNGIGYGDQKSFRTYGTEATVFTLEPEEVFATQIIPRGRIDSNGGESITSYGFVYATTENPTLENEKVVVGSDDFTGEFKTSISNLLTSTTYYVRAYSTNVVGTVYGEQKVITTLSGIPQMESLSVDSVDAVSAELQGKIISDAGEEVQSYGFVFATTENPTIDHQKVSATTNLNGLFTVSLTELSPSTTYFARSYMTNVVGTGYGEQLQFTTLSATPIVTTNSVLSYSALEAEIQGEIKSDVGLAIESYGFVFSTSQSPTINNNKTEAQSVTNGVFKTSISGLNPSTKYYIKAYATNAVTTGYGDELSITTDNGLAKFTSLAASNVAPNSVTLNATYESSGAAESTELGFLLGTSSELDISNGTKYLIDDNSIGNISANIDGLNELTDYYFRPFAKNQYGYGYGTINTFTTKEAPFLSITSPTGFSQGTLGEAFPVVWSTNLGNTLVNVDVVDLLDESAPIAIGMAASTGNVNWNIPQNFPEGDYKIRITKKSNGEILAESPYFPVIAGCEWIPMQDEVFETWLFEEGYDDLIDHQVNSCKLGEIKELVVSHTNLSTRVDWSIFRNLEKLTFYLSYLYESNINLSFNSKLKYLKIASNSTNSNFNNGYRGSFILNDELEVLEYASGVKKISSLSYYLDDYPNLKELYNDNASYRPATTLSKLEKIHTYNFLFSGSYILNLNYFPNLVSLKMNYYTGYLIRAEKLEKLEFLSTGTYNNSSRTNCEKSILISDKLLSYTGSWVNPNRIVVTESCIDSSIVNYDLDNISANDKVTTEGNPTSILNRNSESLKAVRLDGVDDSFLINNPNYNNFPKGNNFLSFWVKIPEGENNSDNVLLSMGSDSSTSYPKRYITLNNGVMRITLQNSNTIYSDFEIDISDYYDQWINIGIQQVNSSSNSSIVEYYYLNGERFTNYSYYVKTLSYQSSNFNIQIGMNYFDDSASYFKGEIDDVIWNNNTLSRSEIYLIGQDLINY